MIRTYHFKPTIMQEQAMDFIDKFMKSSDIACTLAGYAGTGKTSILKHYIKQKYSRVTVVTAFTHKAVINISNGTGLPGKTVHSLLGLQPNMKLETFNPNNPTFSVQGLELLNKYRIAVVDECSQIGKKLFEYLISRAIAFKVKIIFVGDPCQLPPINEYLSDTFKIERIFWLTEILRQKEHNPVLDLLDISRKDVLNKTSNLLTELLQNPKIINDKGEGYTVLNKADFQDILYNQMKIIHNPDELRYLAYTRENTDRFNLNIHSNIHNYEGVATIHPSDILTAHTTLVDDFMQPILVNSLDYTVSEILEFTTDDNIDVYAIKLKDNINNTELVDTFLIVKHEINNLKKLIKLLEPLYSYAIECKGSSRKTAWVEYFKIRKRYLLMFDIQSSIIGNLEKDISYGYGLTTYKAQGSTYDNVFINMLNICCYRDTYGSWITNTPRAPYAIDLRNKHLYVALSRTNTHNYILFK